MRLKLRMSLPAALLLILFCSVLTENARAQIGVGGGLDIRSEDPTSGYGIRLEYTFFELPPLAEFRLRMHGSYFSEEKTVRFETSGLETEVVEKSASFDVGAAALAGVNIGLIYPFGGLGFGVDSSEFNPSEGVNRYSPVKEENIFWNVLFGAELKFFPYVRPYFEYRYVQLINSRNIDFSETERLSVGVIFRF